jgi:hypothetical protein
MQKSGAHQRDKLQQHSVRNLGAGHTHWRNFLDEFLSMIEISSSWNERPGCCYSRHEEPIEQGGSLRASSINLQSQKTCNLQCTSLPGSSQIIDSVGYGKTASIEGGFCLVAVWSFCVY